MSIEPSCAVSTVLDSGGARVRDSGALRVGLGRVLDRHVISVSREKVGDCRRKKGSPGEEPLSIDREKNLDSQRCRIVQGFRNGERQLPLGGITMGEIPEFLSRREDRRYGRDHDRVKESAGSRGRLPHGSRTKCLELRKGWALLA